VEAPDWFAAWRKTHDLGLNPGGDVRFHPTTGEPDAHIDRFFDAEEANDTFDLVQMI